MIDVKIHELKILPEYYKDVLKRNKTFELRKNDRDYQVGDLILLREFNGEYTGRQIGYMPIIYVLKDCPEYGLKEGYCIFSWGGEMVE